MHYFQIVFFLCAFVAVWAGETPHTRKYFYVGGKVILSGINATTHYLEDQIYVEELTPVGGSTKPYPLVFIHGLGQTGTNWLNKPDDRPGWASYFLSHGYTLYLLDVPSRGRSPWLPPPAGNATLGPLTAEVISQRFTAPELSNTYPSAHFHTQWPGNGSLGDPVFDAYYAGIFPSVFDNIYAETTMQAAGSKLLEKIGRKVILIGHSAGGTPLFLLADSKPELIHSIVALEPAGPPFIEPPLNGGVPARLWGVTNIPVAYSPTVTDPSQIFTRVLNANSTDLLNCTIQDESKGKPKELVNLKKIEMGFLVVTAEASWHSQYDWCTVLFLQQAGVNVQHTNLADVGVHGNGHMMFLEKNSDVIAGVVNEWIEKGGSH